MKNIVKSIVVLSAAIVMAAAAQQQDNGHDAQAEQDRPAPIVRKEVQELPPSDVQWPQPFIPSEQISADSVVSFPADI